MDIVLILLVVAIIVVGIFFKDFKSVVYFLGIIEIFFRIIHKVASLLGISDFSYFVDKYIPLTIIKLLTILYITVFIISSFFFLKLKIFVII